MSSIYIIHTSYVCRVCVCCADECVAHECMIWFGSENKRTNSNFAYMNTHQWLVVSAGMEDMRACRTIIAHRRIYLGPLVEKVERSFTWIQIYDFSISTCYPATHDCAVHGYYAYMPVAHKMRSPLRACIHNEWQQQFRDEWKRSTCAFYYCITSVWFWLRNERRALTVDKSTYS